MSSSKAGVVGGVLLACVAGLARIGDNCAGVAGRSARFADDAAGLDQLRRLGRGAGEVSEVSDGIRPPIVRTGGGGQEVAKFGVDLTVELWSVAPEAFPPVQIVGETRCPRVVDLTVPSAWDALLAGSGVACEPVIVVGLTRAPGTLLLRLEDASLTEMAMDCAAAGGTCVFVGCGDAECLAAALASARKTNPRPQLAAYLTEFVGHVRDQTPAPVFLGQLVLEQGDLRLAVTETAKPPTP